MAAHAPLAGRRARHTLAAAVLAAAFSLAVGCDNGAPPPPPPAATATFAQVTPVIWPDGTPAGEYEDFPGRVPGLPPGAGVTPVPTVALDAEERTAVYRQIVLLLAGAENVPVVYLGPYVAGGERLDETMADMPLPSGLLPRLREADPGRTYEAAEFTEVVGPLEEGGEVDNGGAFVTLGPVEGSPDFEGGVRVRASVYHGVSNAGGYTYDLVRAPSEPSGWVVARTTQDWVDRAP